MKIFINMNTILFDSPNVKYENEIYSETYYKKWTSRQNIKEALQLLLKEKYKIFIISSSASRNVETYKKNLLAEEYPFIPKINVLFFSPGQEKDFLKYINSNDIYIDLNCVEFNDDYPADLLSIPKVLLQEADLKFTGEEIYNLLKKKMQEMLFLTRKVIVLNRNYLYYDICLLSSKKQYCGYLQEEKNDEFNEMKNEIINSFEIGNTQKLEKLDVTLFSYVFNYIIDEMLKDSSNNTYFQIDELYINNVIKNAIKKYPDLNKELLYRCFTNDMNKLIKKTSLIQAGSEKVSYKLSSNIILLFEFSHKNEITEKIEKLKIEYFLFKTENIKKEIEQLLFSRELTLKAKMDYLNKEKNT